MDSTSNLYQPQRQSPKAVILILLKYIRIIVRQMWPILLIVLINPTSGKGIIITIIALGIAFISLIYSGKLSSMSLLTVYNLSTSSVTWSTSS